MEWPRSDRPVRPAAWLRSADVPFDRWIVNPLIFQSGQSVGTGQSNVEQIALAIANRLFLPIDRDYERVFRFPARIAVITFFLCLVLVSFPPIIVYISAIACDYFPFSSMRVSADVWLTWSRFALLTLEVFFVLAISRIVFGEWVAVRSKSTLEELEKRFEQAQTAALTNTRDELANQIRAYKYLFSGVTILTLIPTWWRAQALSRAILHTLTNTTPDRTARFLIAKFTVAFPGGLYGLVAFVIFGLLSFTKVIQAYVEEIASAARYTCP